ncbi:tRNA (N(6)-L-threonylcarbamoyladenosine(37)-C(2))-methylthiotransferase MtaB [Lignipirellula cremea]|uniref:Threonylcarbamoyladenosine tRNA methylthiotransferase MtaB n=1 Tax=Lignipirellula cremea TaxID=2528010 RepID=A0A518DXU4_9BACT|nr:tRNA (N(6)-L-threonylcarbamoyladenosine(37)-C(2))-methylthiotransferase MtaB [Lignipirellula cremea]QDU96668.1 Threonylcarbamoyladenosine tRNA methylthiotransferase MtaB [Lignipirellula cremea]
MPAKLKTVTLGCKVNQYETEYVRQGLVGIGYEDASEGETADLCVVNTCTVTNEGDSKSRQIIRRLARDNPQARIVVMGCYATRAPEEVAALPQVAEVVVDKRELPDLLGRFGVVDIPTGLSNFGDRSRAYIKVQDGCLLRCSYCIIPQVRPQMYSRPVADILAEAERLVDNGYREIVLTGVHLGHFGVDSNFNRPREEWLRLSSLVRDLCRLPGDFRLRLSSIEATEVTRDLLDAIGEAGDKVCSHFHICMQSGSDSVLRRMKRRWGVQRFLDRCRLVRETLDRPAITTDVIVGFPGETDEEFEQTCQACVDAQFSKIHMFPFSARRGTPAADMPDQVTKVVKGERGKRLAEIEADLRRDYYATLIGMPLQVLAEAEATDAPGRLIGTSCRYAPVEFNGELSARGTILEVTPHAAAEDRLLA